MAARTKVFVDITTKTESANKGLAKYAVGVGIAAVAIAGLIKIGKELVDAYAVQEQAEARLEQTIKSTGAAANLTKDQLTDMASGLQEVTKYGDEAIIGAEALLLTFKNVGEKTFPRALESILDVSEAMGTGLKETSIQVGKALNDPIQGLTALRRVGIQFTDSQEATIKSMVAMNDITSAQNIILTELESQFGGVARAAADTATGSFVQMGNATGDVTEALGGLVSTGLKPFAQELTPLITDLADFISLQVTANNVMQDLKDGTLDSSASMGDLDATLTKLNRNLKGAKSLGAPVESIEAQIRAVEGLISAYGIQDTFLIQANDRAKMSTEIIKEEVEVKKEIVEEVNNEVAAKMDLLTLEDSLAIARQEEYDILVGRAENRARLLEEEGEAVEKLKIDYEKLAVGAMGSFATAFEQIGSDGVSVWDVVKQAGKDAMSSVLKGLAQESLARAALALVPGPTFNPVAVAGYTAAAAAAYAASGLVQSFATGGNFIANEPTMIQVGEQGQEEVTIKPTSGNSGGGNSNDTFKLISGDGDMLGWIQRVGIDNRGLLSHTGEQI